MRIWNPIPLVSFLLTPSLLQVLMLYFQLTVRYSKMLADGPPHLVPKV